VKAPKVLRGDPFFVSFVSCFIVSLRWFPLIGIENRKYKDGNNDKL
jgi:hypothetical protein